MTRREDEGPSSSGSSERPAGTDAADGGAPGVSGKNTASAFSAAGDSAEGGGPSVSRSNGGSPPRGGARGKAIVVLAAVFLLGGLAGAAIGRITAMRDLRHMMQGPPEQARANFRLEVLRRHLELTEDQLARIRTVLSESDAEREKLVASCGPGLDDLRKRTDARVREVLTEDQRKRFDDLPARRGRPPGGRPPGGPWPGGPPD